MRKVALRCALIALLLVRPVSAAPENERAFQDVPQDHWAYASVTRLERQGIATSFPLGAFQGPRALKRYEFAVAVQRILAELQRRPELPGVSDEARLRHAVGRKLGLFGSRRCLSLDSAIWCANSARSWR